jgi:hypothetical protein
MNKKKSIMMFVLSTAVLAGALIFDGVSHRRLLTNNQSLVQNAAVTVIPAANAAPAIPKPSAGIPADGSTTDPTEDSDSTQETAVDTAAQTQEEDVTNDDAGNNAGPIRRVILKHIGQPAAAPATPTSPDASIVSAPTPAALAILGAAVPPDRTEAPPLAAKQSLIVPAGTVLTIRLREELASDMSEAGQNFSATLDQDVIVKGKAVIAAGSPVTGKVVLSRPVGPIWGEPALELRLVSINVNKTDLPVVTAIQTFGSRIKGKNKVTKFMKGLVKRHEHQEQEVVLNDQSSCSFTLRQPVRVR